MITIYTSEEIEKIAAAGKLTADTLSMLEKAVRPGISTLELDEMAEKFIRSRGGIPSCKGYEGFPGSICASVNDTVVHGIPSARKILKKGDIISLDLVVELNGYMGDKRAIARVFVSEGTGKITINKRDLAEYFPSTILQYVVKQPLNKLGAAEKYDIKVNLCGGGFTGQSQALRLAIARALVKMNAEDKAALRAEGFMTRDPRSVERKKPGQPKARRRFQFSKR